MKKRLLSLFLCVMMLLTLVPVTALASTGGIEVKSIEYAGEQPVKLREGADKTVCWNSRDTVTIERDPYVMSQLEYTVTYVDYNEGGVEKTETMSGYDLAWRMEGTALISKGDHNSNDADWKAGDTYTVTVSTYDNAKCTVELEIIKNPYQSLKYLGSDPITLVKNEDGFSYDGKWYYAPDNSKARFEAQLTDGTSVTGTLAEIERKCMAWFSSNSYDNSCDFVAGNTYSMWVGCENVGCVVKVNISDESSFAGLEYAGTEPVQLTEGVGFVQEDGSICYSLMIADDPKYTVTLTEAGKAKYGLDSTTFTGTWQEITDTFGISMKEDSDQTTPWEIGGGPYYFTLTLGDASCKVPVVIAGAPYSDLPKQNFTSIELANPNEVLELTEGIDDSFCYNGAFYYSPLDACNPEVTVTLTEEAKQYYAIEDDTLTLSWRKLRDWFYNAYATSSNPTEDGWKLRDDGMYDCPVTIQNGEDIDSTLTLNVLVKLVQETRIQSIQLIGDAVELVTGADSRNDYDDSGNEIDVYYLSNAIEDGRVKFRATLNDGNVIEGTGAEIYDWLGYNDRQPTEDDDACDAQCENPWKIGDTGHSFTVYFGKVSCTVPVTLSGPLVSNIELYNREYLEDYYGANNDFFDEDVELKVTLTTAGEAKFGKSYIIGNPWDLREAMGGFRFSWIEDGDYHEVGDVYELTVCMGGCTAALPVKVIEGTSVELNATNFPDEKFRSYLNETFGTDDCVVVECVTYIDCSNRGIKDLTGIELFPNLKTLECSNNQLTELTISLPNLRTLNCYGNQMTALDVSGCPKLDCLICCENLLETLDVSRNLELTDLRCFDNRLTALDVSKNAKLEYLMCEENRLTALDVSSNPALVYLVCYTNQLTTLDVSRNLKLDYFACGDNPLGTLDVSKNTELLELYCEKSGLSTLDISNNTKLMYLGCDSNKLTALDLSDNLDLVYLYCEENQLTELDVSKHMKLQYLNCAGNKLTVLYLPGTGVEASVFSRIAAFFSPATYADEAADPALASLDCSRNYLTSLNASKCEKLEVLLCTENRSDAPLVVNVAKLENLTLSTVDAAGSVEIQEDSAAVSGKSVSNTFAVNEAILTLSQDGTAKYKTVSYNGKYCFNAVADGVYTLTVAAEDYVTRSETVTVENGTVSGLEGFMLAESGDVNLDGVLDVYDLQRLYEHVTGIDLLAGYAAQVSDVNRDNDTSEKSILDLQRLYDQLVNGSGKSGVNSAMTG